MKQQNRTLTEGPIIRTLLALAIPIMASSFLATAYNIMDMAWVGTLGAKAVAGVGVGGMYMWLSGGLSTLSRMGGQVLVAQAIGGGKEKEAQRCARAAIQMSVLIGLLFGLTCIVFTKYLVGFFHLTDEESVHVAITYTRITCGCVVFNFLNTTLTGLFTATGDSKTPLVANFFGLILNMILDPVLIKGLGIFPQMAANGAAVATVVSQMTVSTILIVRMTGAKIHSIFKGQNYFDICQLQVYKRIAQIGIPAALQSMVYCFISMILTRLIAGFGAEAVAVQRVGGQIEAISWNTAEGVGSALNAFCGQNYGAKKFDRIRKGYTFSWIATFLWGGMILIGFVFFPRQISNIFFYEEAAIILSISYLIIVGFSEPFMAVELITVGAISGLGLTRLCSILSIIITALRIPIALVLERTALGLDGIWWALTTTSILKGITFTITFLLILRREER